MACWLHTTFDSDFQCQTACQTLSVHVVFTCCYDGKSDLEMYSRRATFWSRVTIILRRCSQITSEVLCVHTVIASREWDGQRVIKKFSPTVMLWRGARGNHLSLFLNGCDLAKKSHNTYNNFCHNYISVTTRLYCV